MFDFWIGKVKGNWTRTPIATIVYSWKHYPQVFLSFQVQQHIVVNSILDSPVAISGLHHLNISSTAYALDYDSFARFLHVVKPVYRPFEFLITVHQTEMHTLSTVSSILRWSSTEVISTFRISRNHSSLECIHCQLNDTLKFFQPFELSHNNSSNWNANSSTLVRGCNLLSFSFLKLECRVREVASDNI